MIARRCGSDPDMQTEVGATVPNLGANSKIAWISSYPLQHPLQLNFKGPGNRCKPLEFMARPERFELPTYCSGGNRSIQLSYGRALTTKSLARTPMQGNPQLTSFPQSSSKTLRFSLHHRV